jgi:hypothetical protein
MQALRIIDDTIAPSPPFFTACGTWFAKYATRSTPKFDVLGR